MDTREAGCLAWNKSSHSSDTSNCVEVALAGSVVGVRDSKDPEGGVLTVPPACWREFTGAL
jgi:hypothetical protein